MKKKLTKKKYIEFITKLTGHTKSFVQKNMKINEFIDCYTLMSGTIRYDTWIYKNRIYTQYFLDSFCKGDWYHDFESLEYDWKYSEEMESKERKEMIEEALANRDIR